MAQQRLKVGDPVIWRGGFGTQVPQLTAVRLILRDERELDAADWSDIQSESDPYIVDLDNGHWAYGSQLEPVD